MNRITKITGAPVTHSGPRHNEGGAAPSALNPFHVGDEVELIVSGVVTRVCGIDDSDNTFLDDCGGWHSLDDAVLA